MHIIEQAIAPVENDLFSEFMVISEGRAPTMSKNRKLIINL
ncbi:hypothetical protein SAMN04489800_2803 [Pseudomonas deceptionensis]|uniref:Uncharacterized protein n=1 Tax=Pseudomonas deceptionensis TaxID=882211 RepID=A0A1H5MQ16_PSEDM|nr:hypothetical protein SAMN04489800_2803 [Pseudomonas deceptionensis]